MTQPPRKHTFVWKIVAGGMGGVGKTTFLLRYMKHEFVSDTTMTIGVQFHLKELEHDGSLVKLALWDLGGQERFRFVQSGYIKGAAAALIFFDVGRLATLYDLGDWFKLIRDTTSPTIPILLLGTKIDLEDEATQAQAKEEALRVVQEQHLLGYVPTSSKTGQNVEEAVHQMIGILMDIEKKKTLDDKAQDLTAIKSGKKHK